MNLLKICTTHTYIQHHCIISKFKEINEWCNKCIRKVRYDIDKPGCTTAKIKVRYYFKKYLGIYCLAEVDNVHKHL